MVVRTPDWEPADRDEVQGLEVHGDWRRLIPLWRRPAISREGMGPQEIASQESLEVRGGMHMLSRWYEYDPMQVIGIRTVPYRSFTYARSTWRYLQSSPRQSRSTQAPRIVSKNSWQTWSHCRLFLSVVWPIQLGKP